MIHAEVEDKDLEVVMGTEKRTKTAFVFSQCREHPGNYFC